MVVFHVCPNPVTDTCNCCVSCLHKLVTDVFHVCINPVTGVFHVCMYPVTDVFHICVNLVTGVFHVCIDPVTDKCDCFVAGMPNGYCERGNVQGHLRSVLSTGR